MVAGTSITGQPSPPKTGKRKRGGKKARDRQRVLGRLLQRIYDHAQKNGEAGMADLEARLLQAWRGRKLTSEERAQLIQDMEARFKHGDNKLREKFLDYLGQ